MGFSVLSSGVWFIAFSKQLKWQKPKLAIGKLLRYRALLPTSAHLAPLLPCLTTPRGPISDKSFFPSFFGASLSVRAVVPAHAPLPAGPDLP